MKGRAADRDAPRMTHRPNTHIGTPSETIDAEKEFLLHPRNRAVAGMAYVDSRYVYQDNCLGDHPPIWGTPKRNPC